MKRYGPDSLSSWVITFACCFISMMMAGTAKLSGVLFVASIPRYKVGREKASFPYTFCDFVRNSLGPLVGYLGHKFGLRLITAIGAVVGALGAGLCYFAESIEMVTFLWGVIFGFGFAFSSILLPVSINQHFDRNIAVATGIALIGVCLGTLVLPPIVEILIDNYGLSQTFVFLAGFILNCLPAALLLRKPDFEIVKAKDIYSERSAPNNTISGKKGKIYTIENDSFNPQGRSNPNSVFSLGCEIQVNFYKNNILIREECPRIPSTQTILSDYSSNISNSEQLDEDKIIKNNKHRSVVDFMRLDVENLSPGNTDKDCTPEKDKVFHEGNCSLSEQQHKEHQLTIYHNLSAVQIFRGNKSDFLEKQKNETHQSYGYQQHIVETNSSKDKQDVASKNNNSRNSSPKRIVNRELNLNFPHQNFSDDFNYLPEHLQKSCTLIGYGKKLELSNSDSIARQNHAFKKNECFKANTRCFLGPFSIIFDPMFALITITKALHSFTSVCMVTIIIDYARDLNVGESNEKYVLMLMSVGSILGFICLGFITDHGYISMPAFNALCFACRGLFIAATVWANGLSTLLAFSTLYGLSESGTVIIFLVIMAQYFEPEKQTIAIPTSNFLCGPLCLAVSPLIGYFRDDVGAYDWLFYGLAILSAACCFAWMFAPCIAKYQKCNRTNT